MRASDDVHCILEEETFRPANYFTYGDCGTCLLAAEEARSRRWYVVRVREQSIHATENGLSINCTVPVAIDGRIIKYAVLFRQLRMQKVL